jgi:hypothetical protein
LCNRRIPLKARIARFYGTCGRTLLVGCGAWTITDALAHEIAVCERRFLLRMMPRKKTSVDESWVQYLSRLDAKLDELWFDLQIVPLLGQCLLAYFWSGWSCRASGRHQCPQDHSWLA